QTGCESYRHSGLSLLDAEDEAAAQKKWEPTSTSRNSRLPQPRQTQTQRLSPLYPGGCRRSGPSSVSGRRLPEFLLNSQRSNLFTKFILDRQDQDKIGLFRAAA